jgi:DNA-binding transcriptional LysR family regulator
MTAIRDLNLLHALDALLQEGSVTRAAARAHITTPAMSRALGRLRDAIGDPLLVRAGRTMVLTPFALSVRERVRLATLEGNALLGPAASAPVATMDRTLVIRCSDAVAALLVGPLFAASSRAAPGLRVQFVPEGNEDAAALRDGRVDLDIGVAQMPEPELRSRRLVQDRFVCVVRRGHPLSRGRLTPQRFVKFAHLSVSRTGKATGPIDARLAGLGLARRVAAVVPTFFAALFAAASSDLVASVPGILATQAARVLPLHGVALPVDVPSIPIAQTWHPRLEVDPAHRWLRGQVEVIVKRVAESSEP